MITIREIADDNTSISSTRWAFALVVYVDVFIVLLTVISGLVCYIIGKPIEIAFYGAVAMLLGVITGIIGTNKALQGWEPQKDKSGDEK